MPRVFPVRPPVLRQAVPATLSNDPNPHGDRLAARPEPPAKRTKKKNLPPSGIRRVRMPRRPRRIASAVRAKSPCIFRHFVRPAELREGPDSENPTDKNRNGPERLTERHRHSSARNNSPSDAETRKSVRRMSDTFLIFLSECRAALPRSATARNRIRCVVPLFPIHRATDRLPERGKTASGPVEARTFRHVTVQPPPNNRSRTGGPPGYDSPRKRHRPKPPSQSRPERTHLPPAAEKRHGGRIR